MKVLSACILKQVFAILCGTFGMLAPVTAQETQKGIASFYSDALEGRSTANGERYYKDSLTAAHRTLPFGTVVRVVNLDNKKEVVVRINDRGPFVKGRILDLSKAAARILGILKRGKARVQIDIVR